MKKFLLILLILLLLGGIGFGTWYLLDNPQIFDTTVTTAAPKKEKEEDEKGKIGAVKKPETEADLLDAIAHEQTQNPDTVGWLQIPGTEISDSVVQSYNNTYYLRRTTRLVEDIYGCYFADYDCSIGARDVLSPNTVIYGHSDLKDNPDGPKFSQLFRFTDRDFATKTPYIQFATLEDRMTWQVFAAFFTDVNMPYIKTGYTGEELIKLTDEAKAKSAFVYDVPITGEDKILTLSTCSVRDGTTGAERFVVMAKLVPADAPLSRTVEIGDNVS